MPLSGLALKMYSQGRKDLGVEVCPRQADILSLSCGINIVSYHFLRRARMAETLAASWLVSRVGSPRVEARDKPGADGKLL